MNDGAIFKITAKGKETILHDFLGPDGTYPVGLAIDSSGTLYGTTEYGGTSTYQYCGRSCGTVFEITKEGKETVLHNFSAPPGDGILPQAGVVLDWNGTLYGTTTFGGDHAAYGNPGEGTIYKIAHGKETVLYSFTGGSDGGLPSSAPLLSRAQLYVEGEFGGGGACGSVFGPGCGTAVRISPSGETTLYGFGGVPDGEYPANSLVADRLGNLYGATSLGGDFTCAPNPPGCGVVFKITPGGNETLLYAFTGLTDGNGPSSALVMDPAGNLYGAAVWGGDLSCNSGLGCGLIFKIDVAGSFSVLHRFTGPDGIDPESLIMGTNGKLYGTAAFGGQYGYGVVFELAP